MADITQKQIEKYKAMEEELKEFYRQRNEEIVRFYGNGKNGWTFKSLADKYGLKRQRVAKIIEVGRAGK